MVLDGTRVGSMHFFFFYGRTELNRGDGGWQFGNGQGTIFLVPPFFLFCFPHVRIRRDGKVNDHEKKGWEIQRDGSEGDFGLSLG